MALNSILNRTVETVRGGLGSATKLGRGAANQGMALGKRFANRNPQPKEGMDDVTLTRKVESEIFRPKGAPKGKIDVNAVEGVVWLRGEVKNQAQSTKIETQVRAIPEVRGVENLLHLPKTPAPSRTRGGAKKTTTKKSASQGKRFERGQTAEKPKSTKKDPSPTEKAAASTGRQAAPLGTQDPAAPAKTTSESVTGGTTPTPATGGGPTNGNGGTESAS
jgi:osmotically-inducible protein OsmY